MGYLADMTFESVFTFIYLNINGAFLVLFISICLHHRAFFKIVEELVRKWNENGNGNGNKKRYKNDEEFLRNLITFHISAKRCGYERTFAHFNIKINKLVK